MIELLRENPLVLLAVLVIGALAFDRLRQRPADLALAIMVVLGVDVAATGVLRLASGSAEVVVAGPQLALNQGVTAALALLSLAAVAIGNPRSPGAPIAQAALGFALALAFSSLWNGQGFPEPEFRLFVGLLGLWVAPPYDLRRLLVIARLSLGAVLAASVVAVVLLPSLSTTQTGGLPGLPFRAFGSTNHPNTLGWYAFLYLVLDLHVPTARPWRVPLRVGAIAMLLLAQSKTVWVIALLVGAVVLWPRLRPRERGVLFGATSVALVLVGAVLVDELGRPQQLAGTPAENLVTLTGRTQVWRHGWEQFLASPVFGNGGDVFDRYARSTGRTWAAQAHNQVVQTLAEGGLLAVTALLAYWGGMVRLALRATGAARSLAIGLFGGIILRSMTETPMDRLALGTVLVFCLTVSLARAEESGLDPSSLLAESRPEPSPGGRPARAVAGRPA